MESTSIPHDHSTSSTILIPLLVPKRLTPSAKKASVEAITPQETEEATEEKAEEYSESEKKCFFEGFDFTVDLALAVRRPEGLFQNFTTGVVKA